MRCSTWSIRENKILIMTLRNAIATAFIIGLVVFVVYLIWWQQIVGARYAQQASIFRLEVHHQQATAEVAQTIIANEIKARSTALSSAYSWATSQAETVIERDRAEELYATTSAKIVATATFQAQAKVQQRIQAQAYDVAVNNTFEQVREVTQLNKSLQEISGDLVTAIAELQSPDLLPATATVVYENLQGLKTQNIAIHAQTLLRGTGWEATKGALLAIEAFRVSESHSPILQNALWELDKPVKEFDAGGRTVDISPDGKWVVTAGDDGLVKVFDLDTGEQRSQIEHGSGRVWMAEFTNNGQWVVTNNYETVNIWEAETGRIIRVIDDVVVWWSVASSDGSRIAVATDNRRYGPEKVRLYNILTGKEIAVFDISDAWDLTFSPDNQLLAIGCLIGRTDRNLGVWNAQTGAEIFQFNHEAGVNDIAFSPDSQLLALADDDKVVRVWDVNTGQIVTELPHTAEVWSVDFSPNGKLLATGSGDIETNRGSMARIWDLNTEMPLLQIPHTNRVMHVEFSPDGWLLMTSTDVQGDLRLFWTNTGVLSTRIIYATELMYPHFTPNSEQIITGNDDGIIRMWRTRKLIPRVTTDLLIEETCRRLSRNLTLKEWQEFFGDEPYGRTCDNLPIDPAFLTAARELAGAGNLTASIKQFQRANELDPSLALDPQTEANRAYAKSFVKKGQNMARQGNITETVRLYSQAQLISPDLQLTAGDWHTLCWFGGLWKYPDVTRPACDKAIELDPKRGYHYESRSITRILSGDYQGAIEDLEVYIGWLNRIITGYWDEEAIEKKKRYQSWIDQLRLGQNPLDDETLSFMRRSNLSQW